MVDLLSTWPTPSNLDTFNELFTINVSSKRGLGVIDTVVKLSLYLWCHTATVFQLFSIKVSEIVEKCLTRVSW